MRLALILLLVTSVAHADARSDARAHFRDGAAHFRAGRWDEAIAAYQAAYDAAPLPGLLFNLAQAYREKGDRRRALALYQKYLAAQPASGPIAEAQRYVAQLSSELADNPTPAPTEETEESVEESAPSSAPPPRLSLPVAPPSLVEGPRQRGLVVAGVACGGAGVVALGGGLAFWLRARSIAGELSGPRESWSAELDRKAREDLPAARRNATIFAIAGGGLLATGVTLWVVGRRREITVLPTGSGVQVFGSF